MKYVGIDLGTTNSAICSYDGDALTLYKSPEQNDVTPSAIFFDKRGNKHVGARAYANAAMDPDNVATAFKRLMGTSTPIKIASLNKSLTPEECSAEILKTLFGFLPEEIRNSSETGTVITVPAAFNQMQKDATMSAAEMAGLGRVALMQEPVAAVMSVMRHRAGDGTFIIFDLGGGTLDVAIAQSEGGHVSLLSHGGAPSKGGRDFDKLIVDNVVIPWLRQNFELPESFYTDPKSRPLRMALWVSEKAKIELSQKDTSIISADEAGMATKDAKGKELYIDVEISREKLNELIASMVEESIQVVRETMDKAGLTASDIDRIVFVGGPTNYKPLRDRVSQSLGIAASTDVNPMTAVAEGAAIFAESIDWNSQSHGRKNARGSLSSDDGPFRLTLNYVARTPAARAKIIAQASGNILPGTEFQVDSLDTGWSSGKVPLRDGAAIDLTLSKPGENLFKVFVFDPNGGPISMPTNRIVITRTAAAIDAIPASSSIGIEVLDKLGGRPKLVYFVREGESLPKKGVHKFIAGESLRSGSSSALNFKIREGDIPDPVTDNRFIGLFSVRGTDFEDGVITAGAELFCDYEILDSGNVIIKVSVPMVGGVFSARNYYSRQAGEIDYTRASKQIAEETEKLRNRLDAIAKRVVDPKLDKAFEKLDEVKDSEEQVHDPETAKRAMDNVEETKKLLSEVRQKNIKEIRQIDLDKQIELFEGIREHARPSEASSFDNLVKTAQGLIEQPGPRFEAVLAEMRSKIWGVVYRLDWFIVDRFKSFAEKPHLFPDANEHAALVNIGRLALQNDDMDSLRKVVGTFDNLRIRTGSEDDMLAVTNIVGA